jgi:glycine oxidase
LLSPWYGDVPAGPLVDLACQGAAMYANWVGELRQDGAGDVGYRVTGMLHVALGPQEAGSMQRSTADLAHARQHARWLDEAELRRLEPALTPHVGGAVLYPDIAHVEPARLVEQVARVAELAGVVVHENEPVRRLVRHGDRITAVQTAQGQYQPDLVVLTAGAWSGELLGAVGPHLPTRPVKGQMLMAACRVPPVQTPMHAGEALLVPWPDGRLALGVTVEEAGFHDRVELAALQRILDQAIALVPAVGKLPFSHAWAGLRPATPDAWPYMGPGLPLDNLWISTGHFRKGTLLAPICARLLAASILAGQPVEELAPFKPTRKLSE